MTYSVRENFITFSLNDSVVYSKMINKNVKKLKIIPDILFTFCVETKFIRLYGDISITVW